MKQRSKIKKKKKTATPKGKKYSFKDRLNKCVNKVNLDYVIPFGKHKGYSLKFICATDPQYIQWCMQKNLLDFEKEVIDYMIVKLRKLRKKQEAEREEHESARRKHEENTKKWGKTHRKYAYTSQDHRTNFDDFFGHFFNEQKPNPAQNPTAKVASPAERWDHLPEKQRHGKILGIQGGTIKKSRIRELYKKQLLAYHPDKCAELGEEIQKLSHEMTVRINEAYKYFKKVYSI